MRFVILFALTSLCGAQTDADFHFIHIQAPQQFLEIATLVRTIGDIPTVSPDAAQGVLHVAGTQAQIALASWLFRQLDRPAGSQPTQSLTSDIVQYTVPDSLDNTVRLFYLPYAHSRQAFEELLTAVRSTSDIRRMFSSSAQNIAVARGTPDQIALAAWLFQQFGDPSVEHLGSQIYHMPSATDPTPLANQNTVRVYHLARVEPQEVQEVATLVRSIADVRRLFTFTPAIEFSARGSAGQIALIDWLLPNLNFAASPGGSSATYQVTEFEPRNDNSVRIFYFPQSLSIADFQTAVARIRRDTATQRVYTFNRPRAAAFRGSQAQIEQATREFAEITRSK